MTERVVQIRVTVDDTAAAAKLDALKAKLDKLTKDVWKIRIRLDDGGAGAQLDKLAGKLDKISKKDYTPKIKLDGLQKFNAAMDLANAKLDRFNRRRVTATVGVIGGSAGGGGGGGGGDSSDKGEGGLWKGLGGAASTVGGLPWTGIGIAAASVFVASLLPALVPMVLGLGIGGGVGRLAITQGTTGLAAIQADMQALATARAALRGAGNNTPSNRLALRQAQAQLQTDQARYGAFLPIGRAAGVLGPQALQTLLGALTANAPGRWGGNHAFGNTIPNSSFLSGLTGILQQISGFIKSIGPGLGAMFRASLPILMMFVKSLETLAKLLMPAFTQSMNALKPVLPIIQQGFKFLAQGIAGFINALGPGTKDAAIIFKTTMMVIRTALIVTGHLAAWLAIAIVKIAEAAKWVAKTARRWWDELRHNTAVIFDGMRHEIAHIWDIIYNNTIGLVSHITRDVSNQSHALWHNIASTYDTIRHTIASAWNAIWTGTIGAVKNGISAVVKWFKGLPGQVLGALKGLGSGLLALGKAALNALWSGMKSVGASILGWLKSFIAGIPSAIMHLLGMSPPHPGSAFYDLGANFMHHLEAGMKSRAASVANAARGVSGSSAAAYAHALANRIGWGGQWGAINAIAMRESGWNMRARNPSSGAYGIAQFIQGPSEYYKYGGNPNTIAGQVIAFFNYIRQRYGSPNAAWGHELRFGWYDKGGKLPPGLSLALNTTGRDEIHATGPGGGAVVYNINVTGDFANPDATALRVIQAIRDFKRHHGNYPTGIG